MEILLMNKGFVTNSSSANYWLDDGELEPEEMQEYLSQMNKVQELNVDVVLRDRVIDFSIWFCFSIILVIIFFIFKLKKKC